MKQDIKDKPHFHRFRMELFGINLEREAVHFYLLVTDHLFYGDEVLEYQPQTSNSDLYLLWCQLTKEKIMLLLKSKLIVGSVLLANLQGTSKYCFILGH